MCFTIFSFLPLLNELFATPWNNELPHLRIGLMAALSEYAMIRHKIMARSGYECGEFALASESVLA
jgi:hypothetical protein